MNKAFIPLFVYYILNFYIFYTLISLIILLITYHRLLIIPPFLYTLLHIIRKFTIKAKILVSNRVFKT